VSFLLVIFSLDKQRKVTRPEGAKALALLQSFKAKSLDPRLRGDDEQARAQMTGSVL
jgi:hypothetical protein